MIRILGIQVACIIIFLIIVYIVLASGQHQNKMFFVFLIQLSMCVYVITSYQSSINKMLENSILILSTFITFILFFLHSSKTLNLVYQTF
jgi:hypothetical protein